ncbi:MAG: purine-nucleoside phosphorylase [Planctomycetes bacterium]|nr:purine-nucleoside phosphorylase [Planctomycetota bacterium]
MSLLKETVDLAAERIRKDLRGAPEFGIVLGTGLGGLAKEIRDRKEIPYDDIPGFMKSTAIGHRGQLVVGTIEGRTVAAMEGRFHLYEGYTVQEVTFPVRVMRALGAKVLVVSNACGGMNPRYAPGDLVLIEDHINMMGVNPLVGPNDDRLGPRFPDMCAPYDKELLRIAEEVALQAGIKTHQGVYVALVGPNLETRAEYRFLRTIGADCVGMSTVPEVLVAVHAGLRVLGFSIVTDACFPDALKPANIEEILATANAAEPKLTAIVKGVIRRAKL